MHYFTKCSLYMYVLRKYIVFNITRSKKKKVADMTQIGLQADEKTPWREKKLTQ